MTHPEIPTDELERLAAEITPGPWVTDENGQILSQTKWFEGGVEHTDFRYPNIIGQITDNWDQSANARAIALVPALLRELIERREADERPALCASGQVRALADENARLNAALLVLGAYLMEKGEAFRVGEGSELLDAYSAALTPASQPDAEHCGCGDKACLACFPAATTTAQDAVPTEDELDEAWKSGFNAGFGEAMLTAHPPQPSVSISDHEGIVYALQIGRAYVAEWVKNDGGIDQCDIEFRADLEAIDAALRALKGES